MRTQAITTAALGLLLLALVACQPTGDGQAQPENPLAQWMPQVTSVSGTCDAALYVQTGPLTTRVVVNAVAAADVEDDDVRARVAVESAVGSYQCTYKRGAEAACEQGPPVPVVPPESLAEPAADFEETTVPAPRPESDGAEQPEDINEDAPEAGQE